MIIYEVTQKYYDNGKVDVNFHRYEMDSKPDNRFEEHPHFDLYHDYFTNEKKAEKFYKDAKRA